MKTTLRKALSLLLAVMMIFGTAAVGITYVGYAEEECKPESSKDVWEDEEVPTLNPGNPDRPSTEDENSVTKESGTCGEKLIWSFDETTGTLSVSGTGAMNNYDKDSLTAPWQSYGFRVKAVIISDGVTGIGDYAFSYMNGLTDVTIPDSVTCIGDGAFYCCGELSNISIPNKVTNIGERAFMDCYSLVSITIPDTVTSISDYAFYRCSSLISVVMGKNVKSIGESAFFWCEKLESISLPDSLTDIGYGAFEWCDSLKSVMIPNGVTIINKNTFSHCDNLKTVIIPNSVTSICSGAFWLCNGFTDVYFTGSKKQWNAISIEGANDPLNSAIVHYGVYNTNWVVDGKQTTQEVKVGAKITPPANPTKSGYVFKGWSPSVPATMPEKDMTFTAVFEKAVYNVTWVVDGAKTTHKYEFGAKITTPANPTKSGYVFKGWSPSVPATMPAKDMTFTAVFEIDSSKFIATDRFWFGNSSKHFVTSWSNNAYYISDADMNKLANYIKKYEYRPNSTISSIQRLKNSEWGGSCYGMAAVVLLDKSNAIAFNENFGNGAKSMCEVASPNTSKTIMSAINYYMLSQKINFIDYSSYYYSSSNSNWSQGLKKLVETAKAGKPFLFCYYFDRGGHAIVAYDYKLAADGSHNIITYDNRYPNKDLIIVIDKNYKTSTLVTPGGNEIMLGVEFYPDMKAFDKIDIDGPANDMKITYSDYSYSSSNHTIEILAEGNVTVTNEEGKTLTYSNGVVGGDMNVISTHMIVNSTEDGNPAAPTLVFEVSPSGSFTFESSSDEMSASVMSDTMYASADSKNADCIVIGNDEGVYVMGEDIEYNATLSSKNEGYDTINIDGEATKDISLTYNKNDVVASGVNGSNGNVSVYSNVINVDSYKYKSGYNDIMITSDGKDNGDIDILGSKDNGETFGASVKIDESALNVDIRTPSTTSITYGDSIILHADIDYLPEGAKIVWTADNGNFTYTASADGSTCTVSPSANGDTTFTATVVDANGNEIGSDTQSMTSKAGFFQKIIAFFKNLFGLTKVIPEVFEF